MDEISFIGLSIIIIPTDGRQIGTVLNFQFSVDRPYSVYQTYRTSPEISSTLLVTEIPYDVRTFVSGVLVRTYVRVYLVLRLCEFWTSTSESKR